MPRPRSAMHKIREVLRLAADGRLTQRQIATATGMSRATVQRCIERARAAGLSWPLAEELNDRALETKLFGRPAPRDPTRPLPDWEAVHRELRRKGMTLMLLWEEYPERAGPRAYEYSQFCPCSTDKVAATPGRGHAAAASGGREAVRGLRWRDAADHRPEDGWR